MDPAGHKEDVSYMPPPVYIIAENEEHVTYMPPPIYSTTRNEEDVAHISLPIYGAAGNEEDVTYLSPPSYRTAENEGDVTYMPPPIYRTTDIEENVTYMQPPIYRAVLNEENVTYMPPPIYRAAAQGNINIILRAIRRGIDPCLTPKKNTILHIAAQFGQLSCVERIIDQYHDIDSSLLLFMLQCPNLKGDYPLHLAAREGHLEVVKALIQAARQLTLESESIEIEVDKAMLRMTNNDNDTALHEAVRYHYPHIVEFLIQEDPGFTYGANFSGATPLYMAAERGFTDLVKIIIQNTIPTNLVHTGPFGKTALHAAVVCHDLKMVEEILEWNPNLTKEVDENGWSPLHCAAYLYNVSIVNAKIVRKLLRKSDRSVVYLRVKNDDNKTALLIAATHGNVVIARILVSRYPDCCEQVDVNGNNALHLFMMQKKNFNRLLKIPWMNVGSLLNEKNVDGQTPLHLLADSQLRIRPNYIKNKKVDKMALDNKNLTAMDITLLAEDLFGRKDRIIRRLRRSQCRVGPLLWQKKNREDEVEKKRSKTLDVADEREIIMMKNNKGLDTSFLKKASDIHLLVAALVATVSFAAGFTLPGGYNDSDGMAKLSNKSSFGAFIVADSMALVLSVIAMLCHFYTAMTNNKKQVIFFIKYAYWCTKLGVGAMVVAFLTNLQTVLPNSGIATFTFIICVCISVLTITSGTPAKTRYI